MAYLVWQLNIGESGVDENYVQPDECQVWLLGTDGINFEDGPRFVFNPPYNGSVVIPPGGRADVMVVCFESGIYTVFASNNTRNTIFQNAPLPSESHEVMHFIVTDVINGTYIDPIPCSNVSNQTGIVNDCQCEDWDIAQLPCQPIPYSVSPYLTNTTDLTYPDVTGQCNSDYSANDMKLSL